MAGEPSRYNSNYDPRPPPGYNQGPTYQPGYGQPAYGQAGPYPMYMPVPVPPKKDNTVSIVVIVVVVVVLLVIILPVMFAFLMVRNMEQMGQSGGNVETMLGMRIEKTSGSDWLVTITTGSTAVSSTLYIQVADSNTGAKTVSTPIKLGPTSDFQYNDNNANQRIDAGDSILLKGSSPNIKAGYRFQLSKGENILAGPRELPA